MPIHYLPAKKRIALVAHDGRKKDLIEWAVYNKGTLANHELYGTGGTGTRIAEATGLHVTRFLSGPLGGDQQLGAAIAVAEIDMLVFFWDPLEPQPHDPDVKALLRLAVLHNIPTASNRSSADFLITSPLMAQEYGRKVPDLSRRMQEIREDEAD
ncbi:MAG: methylglyoxal synthase [Anaerolineales bacterium]|jgi:methylglyoxal synthase|nr:methylglyoxal synthase [Anaerolineales bacterium]MCW5888731.1 methylglyoxal synthase [Anaerolineales bacterium]